MKTGFSLILKSKERACCKAPFAAAIFPVSMLITAVNTCASTLSGSFVTHSCNDFKAFGMSLDNHQAFARIINASEIEGYCLKTFSKSLTAFARYLGYWSPFATGLLFACSKYSFANSIKKSAFNFV